jgi:hypothetical protein
MVESTFDLPGIHDLYSPSKGCLGVPLLYFITSLCTEGRRAGVAEDAWGIGQIGAMFAWAPLLVEMGYSALELALKRPLQGVLVTSSDTDIVMHDSVDSGRSPQILLGRRIQAIFY